MRRETTTGDIVIVGSGPTGHRLAEQLRRYGHGGAITLLDRDPRPPYHRALLPSVLDGGLDPAALELPPLPEVRGLRGVAVTGVDRAGRRVWTDAGDCLPYDTLVLATGAEPRIPPVPGIRTPAGRLLDGVTGLRSPADCARVTGDRIVVLGAGPLGLETAVALRRCGRDVTLVQSGPYPLHHRLDARAGELLAGHLVSLGIRLESGRSATLVERGKLHLDDGGLLAWDTLVCCTGVVPRTRLARAAGLEVRTGVLVDGRSSTRDPAVRAIGSCAERTGWASGRDEADALARLLTGHRFGGPGPGSVLRLRIPSLDIGVLRGPGTDGDEVVTYADPARGRYARMAVDPGGRLSHAVVLGLPHALAALTQLCDERRPLPTDRLALLLGRTPVLRASGPPEQPAHTVLCQCNNVTRRTLEHAWRSGSRTPGALARATRATTGCGTCADALRALCDGLASAAKPVTDVGERADGHEEGEHGDGVDTILGNEAQAGGRRLRHDRPPAGGGAALPGPGGHLADRRPR